MFTIIYHFQKIENISQFWSNKGKISLLIDSILVIFLAISILFILTAHSGNTVVSQIEKVKIIGICGLSITGLDFITLCAFLVKKHSLNPRRWASTSDILDYCHYLYKQRKNLIQKKDSEFNFYVTDKTNLIQGCYKPYLQNALTYKRLFFCPILIKEHWHLFVVDPIENIIEYYDSRGVPVSSFVQECLDVINNFIELKEGKKYNVTNVVTSIHQYNNHDCGPFVAFYMEERLKRSNYKEMSSSFPGIEALMLSYRFSMYSRINHGFNGRVSI